LLSSAVLAMVLAAQTSLACTDKVALPIPASAMPMMPGMDMSAMGDSGGAMMICPIVLGLIIASALLTLSAFTLLWCDPHRALTQRRIVRLLAGLPVLRTAVAVSAAGTAAVAAMLCLEHSVPALPVCAMLVALLVACALGATFLAIVGGHLAIAFGRRLMLAIVAAFARMLDAVAPPALRFVPAVAAGHTVPLLAAGRGLRAPPAFVR
jgi:hypothetical protein